MAKGTTTRDMQTAGILLELARLKRRREVFAEDPMSVGADDIGDLYDAQERRLYGRLLTRSRETGETHVEEHALVELERWMP